MADDAAAKKKATDDAEGYELVIPHLLVLVLAIYDVFIDVSILCNVHARMLRCRYELHTVIDMLTLYSWIKLIRKVLIFPTDGTAVVKPSGLLELTNGTTQLSSHVVHRSPLRLRRSPGNGVRSFSASFVFGIIPPYADLSGHSIVFFVGKDNFSTALPS